MNTENQTTTKPCPFCAEEILSDAVKCKHCGEWLNREAESVQRTPGTNHIGKHGIYLLLLYCGMGICILGGILSAENEDAGIALVFFGIIASVVALIYYFVLFYQVWRFVVNESQRNSLVPSIETPGKAIGYCFIPFYNLYWVFRAFGRFPKDLNVISRAKGSNKMMSEGLGIAIPVLILISIIPFIGYITVFVNLYILYPLFISQAVRICKDISCSE